MSRIKIVTSDVLQTKSTISLIHYEILKNSVLKALKDKGRWPNEKSANGQLFQRGPEGKMNERIYESEFFEQF